MADEGVKTRHIFSPIQAYQNAIIKQIKLSRRRDITLVSSGDEFLHFLEGEKLLKTARLPARLLCAEFCCCDDQKLILALTEDGKVWAVPVPAKISKKSKSNQAPIDAGAKQAGSKSSDQDIFSGLLTGSGPGSTSTLIPSDEKSIVDVGSESLIIFEPNAKSFIYIGGNIITSGSSESGFTVSLYIRTDSKSGKLRYPGFPTLRTTIPVPNQPSSTLYKPRNEVLTYTEYSNTRLLCICPAEGSSSYNGPHLKNELFGQLFGRDALLICSPVLLIGCGSGRIYYITLNVLQPEPTVSQSVNTRQHEEECATFSPKLLYDLEQDLSGVHLANLSMASETSSATGIRNAPDERTFSRKDNNMANAVLFVGSRGKLVLAEKNCSEKAVEFGVDFSLYNVPAPVLCSCLSSRGDVLVHSTGQEIFVTKLCPESPNASSSCVTESLPTGLTPNMIMIPNVCAILSSIKPQRLRSDTGVNERDQILALTFKGRLLEFSMLPLDEAESNEFQQSPLFTLTPDMAAKKVKDALVNIEEVSKQLTKVQLNIEAEDQIIKEVNIAINIICDSLVSSAGLIQTGLQTKAKITQMPISCTLSPVIKLSDGDHSCSVMLQCSVTNQGKRCLSNHWQLLFQVHGYKQWFSSEENHYITVNHSVSLGKLNPGSSRELNIPLDGDFDVMFSVSVEVFLLCDLRSLIARAAGDLFDSAESLQNVSNVIVPVTRNVFSALCFLRPQSILASSTRDSTTPGSLHELADALNILNSVPQGLNCQSEGDPGPKRMFGNQSGHPQIQSASLRLSWDCLDHVKTLAQDMFNESLTAKQISELTAEAALFLFLLADSGLTPQQVSGNSSSVTMATVNGEPATLHLRSLSETPAGATAHETLATTGGVELSIRAPSVQLLSSVHEAVLRRLEPVISRNGNGKSIPSRHIQKALEKLENLQKVSASLSDKLSSRQQQLQMAECGEDKADSCLVLEVWQLYQQLRQIQLILP